MGLRRKIFLIAFVSLLIVSLLVLALTVRDARRMARMITAEDQMKHLAAAVELYQNEMNRYPGSLEELLTGTNKAKDYVEQNRVLNSSFNDKFEYAPSSNGFVIKITFGNWFMKPNMFEKKYAFGETLK